MVLVPEHAHRARLGLLVFVLGFGFVLVAPVGLLTVPLAALLILSPDRSASVVFATAFAGGVGTWWLLSVGDPSEQLVRAGCVLATATFLVLSTTTRWSVVHRSLAAVTVAGFGAFAAVRVLGASWTEIMWWTERRAVIAQSYLMQLWLAGRGSRGVGSSDDLAAAQMEDMISGLPDIMTNLFVATFALQMIAGLALAMYLIGRVEVRVPGAPIGRFEDFRFSEHLGWPVVAALGIALLASDSPWRIPAVNVLMLAAVLYGLRGTSIWVFYLRRRSKSRILAGTMTVLAVVFLWRIILPALIMLGLIDTGLDLRKRMQQPQ